MQAYGAYPAYADSLLKEMGVVLEKEAGDEEILKNGTAVSYTHLVRLQNINAGFLENYHWECQLPGGSH